MVDYQTFGTWIICSIEKSLWLHYFHSNDSQVRKNYLSCLFYESSQVENRKYRYKTLWEFWRDTKREVRQQIFKDLIQKVEKLPNEEQKFDDSENKPVKENEEAKGGIKTIENPLITGPHFISPGTLSLLSGWRVGTKVLDQIKIQDSLIKFTNSKSEEIISISSLGASTQNEIAYLISLGNNMYEIDNFVNFLVFSKLDRWDWPFDHLWRKLFKIIDETQRELTLKELLDADMNLTPQGETIKDEGEK